MTDRETEFIRRWHAERPLYDAWGKFVIKSISEYVSRIVDKSDFDAFFKIPLKHRLKDDASLLAKAFRRDKSYKNPYDDIEDKVGGRVVVLFSEDIRLVEGCLKECDLWRATVARDFEQERLLKPYEFDYQSLHYILRSTKDIVDDEGALVPQNTACEIQIRTLLQHAYSELTHDTIYKPSVQADPKVKRAAAKSMALIEATDEYFTEVRKRLGQALAPGKVVAAILDSVYSQTVRLSTEPSPLNVLLIDHYRQWAQEDFGSALNTFIAEKAYILDLIRGRAPSNLLYRQSAILLVYFSVCQAPRSAAIGSPLARDEIGPIYGDLGQRLPEVVG